MSAPTQPLPPLVTAGRVVSLEGLDGAGTTTQAKLLCQALRDDTFDVVQTFEPSDGPIGTMIRGALARSENLELVDAQGLALLFAADRLEHYERVVRPALDQGAVVVTDRSLISSLAYQGMELPLEWVATLNAYARMPHYVVWVDVPAEVCLDRIIQRGATRDRYEKLDLLQKLHENYVKIADAPPAGVRFIRVDGTLSAADVHLEIWSRLHEDLEKTRS